MWTQPTTRLQQHSMDYAKTGTDITKHSDLTELKVSNFKINNILVSYVSFFFFLPLLFSCFCRKEIWSHSQRLQSAKDDLVGKTDSATSL